MLTRLLLTGSLAIAIGLSVTPLANAEKPEIETGTFSNTAADGYDVVAYFTENAPLKGHKDFRTDYKGAEFRFASQENLDLFRGDPEKYSPQFGGYCAWAVSQGYTAPGNAKYWAIVDGKLYLNYNKKVQTDWDKDRSGFIEKANQNWPNVLTK